MKSLHALVLALALVVLGTGPATAEDAGFLRTESLRYQNANVFKRVISDIPAVPATVVDWDTGDWLTFAGVAVSVGTLMAPLDPPLDLRIDDWVTREVDPWMPDLWGMDFQIPLWTTLAWTSGLMWASSAYVGDEPVAETMSLMAESLAVTQVYHLTLKLALGRADDGTLKGFPTSLKLFPKGTPGGHFATLYTLWGTVEAYWQPHWGVRVAMHSLLAFGAITHSLNHRHFISDQIFGASMGYSVSQWVVRNRSTRFEYSDEGEPMRITIVPSAGGLGVAGTFR